MKKNINKLVRDKIPQQIKDSGRIPVTRKLQGNEFTLEAKRKLVEESTEVFNATSREALVEELADVFEVIDAITKSSGITREDIQASRAKKKAQKGIFEEGIFLESIQVKTDTA